MCTNTVYIYFNMLTFTDTAWCVVSDKFNIVLNNTETCWLYIRLSFYRHLSNTHALARARTHTHSLA